MKKKIRPLYSRLQGMLHNAPPLLSEDDAGMVAKPLSDIFNATIDQLNSLTGNNYGILKMGEEFWSGGSSQKVTHYMKISAYRGKLGALIAEIHGEFFLDEPAPFSGMPNMVINQHTQQSTDVRISVLFEAEKQINELIEKSTNEDETNFLKEVRGKLNNIKTMAEIILLVTETAGKFGINLGRLSEIFSRIIGSNIVN